MELQDALLELGSTDPATRADALRTIASHILTVTVIRLPSWDAQLVEECANLMLVKLCERDRPMVAEHPAAYLRTILRNTCVRAVEKRSKRGALEVRDDDPHRQHDLKERYPLEPDDVLTRLGAQTIVPEDAFGGDADDVVRIIAAHMIEVVAPSMGVRRDGIESTARAIRQLTDIYTDEHTMDELIVASCGPEAPTPKELRQARDKLNRSFSRARERLLVALESSGPDVHDGDLVLMRNFIGSVMSRA